MRKVNARRLYSVGHKDGNKINNRVDNLEWVENPTNCEFDECCLCDNHRSIEEIQEYETEAFDKVWLMRTHPCCNREIEVGRRANIKRIMQTYDDIPDEGYSDWECGYWNGIMGALRWVLGDEKDFLDT